MVLPRAGDEVGGRAEPPRGGVEVVEAAEDVELRGAAGRLGLGARLLGVELGPALVVLLREAGEGGEAEREPHGVGVRAEARILVPRAPAAPDERELRQPVRLDGADGRLGAPRVRLGGLHLGTAPRRLGDERVHRLGRRTAGEVGGERIDDRARVHREAGGVVQRAARGRFLSVVRLGLQLGAGERRLGLQDVGERRHAGRAAVFGRGEAGLRGLDGGALRGGERLGALQRAVGAGDGEHAVGDRRVVLPVGRFERRAGGVDRGPASAEVEQQPGDVDRRAVDVLGRGLGARAADERADAVRRADDVGPRVERRARRFRGGLGRARGEPRRARVGMAGEAEIDQLRERGGAVGRRRLRLGGRGAAGLRRRRRGRGERGRERRGLSVERDSGRRGWGGGARRGAAGEQRGAGQRRNERDTCHRETSARWARTPPAEKRTISSITRGHGVSCLRRAGQLSKSRRACIVWPSCPTNR